VVRCHRRAGIFGSAARRHRSDDAARHCRSLLFFNDDKSLPIDVVGGKVDGRNYYAATSTTDLRIGSPARSCHWSGKHVTNRGVLRDGGAAHWATPSLSRIGATIGGGTLGVVLAIFFWYYRTPRPGHPRPGTVVRGRVLDLVLAILLSAGSWSDSYPAAAGSRRRRLMFMGNSRLDGAARRWESSSRSVSTTAMRSP